MQVFSRDPLAKIFGHSKQKDIIKHQISTDHLPQTILFTGAASIGKTTLAKAIAEMIFTLKARTDAELASISSRINRFEHPDFHIVYPQTGQKDKALKDKSSNTFLYEHLCEFNNHHPFPKSEISIDQIRKDKTGKSQIISLEESLASKPYEADCKIVLMIDADRLSPEASNAFLKTLEEPPGETIFLLTSSASEKLLPTIRSRSFILPLAPLTREEILDCLMNKGFNQEEARFLGIFSQGALGIALSHSYNYLIGIRRSLLKIIYSITSKSLLHFFSSIEEIAPLQPFYKDEKGMTPTSISMLSFLISDVLYASTGREDDMLNIDLRDIYLDIDPSIYKGINDAMLKLPERYSLFKEIPLAPHPFWSSIFFEIADTIREIFSNDRLKAYQRRLRTSSA